MFLSDFVVLLLYSAASLNRVNELTSNMAAPTMQHTNVPKPALKEENRRKKKKEKKVKAESSRKVF